MKFFRLAMGIALLTMLAAPALAQVAEAGVDVFTTPATAGSNIDFTTDPIPADFFCPGSPPFAEVIHLKGVPLVTDPPNVAGTTDTIVERLADVLTNGSSTPVVVRALQLKHTQETTVACGDGTVTQWGTWVHVTDPYAPPAPDSTMQIYTDTFTSHLVVPATVTFYNTVDETDVKEWSHDVSLAGSGNWSDNPGGDAIEFDDPLLVDTDGDDVPDTQVPPTSNFHPGWQGQTRVGLTEQELLAKHGIKPPRKRPYSITPGEVEPIEVEPVEPGVVNPTQPINTGIQ